MFTTLLLLSAGQFGHIAKRMKGSGCLYKAVCLLDDIQSLRHSPLIYDHRSTITHTE